MKIEFNREIKFGSLPVGEFFIDNYGRLYLKISEKEEELNAICLHDVQKGNPALYCFLNSYKYQPCKGKIVIE